MISLLPFDKNFFDSLDDKENIVLSDSGTYYTIVSDGVKSGVVGYIPSKFPPQSGFIQIVIAKDFRGQGILNTAEDLLAEKHDLKVLYATIKENNLASIIAHQKVGFQPLANNDLLQLKTDGFLKPDETRLIKIILP